jgi:hypothetical protein
MRPLVLFCNCSDDGAEFVRDQVGPHCEIQPQERRPIDQRLDERVRRGRSVDRRPGRGRQLGDPLPCEARDAASIAPASVALAEPGALGHSQGVPCVPGRARPAAASNALATSRSRVANSGEAQMVNSAGDRARLQAKLGPDACAAARSGERQDDEEAGPHRQEALTHRSPRSTG